MSNRLLPLEIEDAKIGYRNFSGIETQYNREGDANFAVFLEEDQALEAEALGWNVKWPKPKAEIPPEEDMRKPFISVSVSFKRKPPKIVVFVGEKVTVLDADTVGTLDYAEIDVVDLILEPYHWNINGVSGVKAYLKAIYVTLTQDAFTKKYGI